MFKMIRKIFKAIKDFFTEPKVKTRKEYKEYKEVAPAKKKNIFEKIKDFFAEPKVKTLEDYKKGRLKIYEKELAGLDAEADKREEQLQFPSIKERKGRHVYDERTDSWVLVTEKDVHYKGFEGWGGAKVVYELVNVHMELFDVSLVLESREDFEDWSDTEVLEQFYIEQPEQNRDEYKELFVFKVNTIERINYI